MVPTETENFPAAHDTHDVLPSPGDLPASHASHAVALGLPETLPASHASHIGAPREAWASPGVHGKQAAWPVSFWCVPAAHAVHRVALASSPPRT